MEGERIIVAVKNASAVGAMNPLMLMPRSFITAPADPSALTDAGSIKATSATTRAAPRTVELNVVCNFCLIVLSSRRLCYQV